MPLIERTKESMRKEFVDKAITHEKSKSALCREYGISRPTGDKWIKQHQQGESLADKSRAPHNPHTVSTEMEKLIVKKRLQYPAFGAVKIRRILEDEGYTDLPCGKTINNIFHRNGLITKEASLAATPYTRFQKEYPNEMWQADYKGVLTQTVNYVTLDMISAPTYFERSETNPSVASRQLPCRGAC